MPPHHDDEALAEITTEEIEAIRARAAARHSATAAGDAAEREPAADAERKVQLNVRITPGLKTKLSAHARATNTDMSTVVAGALDTYLAWRRTP